MEKCGQSNNFEKWSLRGSTQWALVNSCKKCFRLKIIEIFTVELIKVPKLNDQVSLHITSFIESPIVQFNLSAIDTVAFKLPLLRIAIFELAKLKNKLKFAHFHQNYNLP